MVENMVNKKVNKNFKQINVDGTIRTAIWLRFYKKMFSHQAYCFRYGLNRDILYKVLDGKLTGQKSSSRGEKTRAVILQLKDDGIWVGDVCWKV
jgi:hypothetical protein